MHIYLAGCGKIGKRLGQELTEQGHRVTGIKRRPENLPFKYLTLDLSDAQSIRQMTPNADVIVFTVTPDDHSEAGYTHVYDTILSNVLAFAKQHKKIPLVLLVSSTGVYGQNNGEWVNEDSPTEPKRFSGKWVLHGEHQVKKHIKQHLIVRFSGIYSQNRHYLINKAISGASIQRHPPIWTNRVHEDDCVNSLAFLIKQYEQGKVKQNTYLISDDTPVSSYDVSAFICRELKQTIPPEKQEGISTQYNKRCDNTRIRSLGFEFRYPSYRNGYSNIIEEFKT